MPDLHLVTRRLPTRLAASRGVPVAHVIADDVWLAVVDGSLETGERLPTAREVAIALGVSPRSVERAYAELERRGVVVVRPGEGTFVSLRPPSQEEHERHRRLAAVCREAVERASELGFGITDLLEGLAEFRTHDRAPPAPENRR